MKKRFEGVGITSRELKPGTAVMVPVGALAAQANGHPCVIAWAIVQGPAEEAAAARPDDPDGVWWLDVYNIPGGPPIPQMYRAADILGVPGLGLSMDGAPPVTIQFRWGPPSPGPSDTHVPPR